MTPLQTAGHRPLRPRYLWSGGWRPMDLDGIPSYSRRHQKRLVTLIWASIAMLAGWIWTHQFVVPDIASRSVVWVGGVIVPHSILVCLAFTRLKPSWREYIALYAIGVAYVPLQFLFSISRSDAAPFLLAGTCFLFLILTNLMMRLRFVNAVMVSVFVTLIALWRFARQGNAGDLILCFAICAFLAAVSTLYINYVIGNDELHYMRREQHLRLVLSGGRRDLWEFDSATQTIQVLPWNAAPLQPPITETYEHYLHRIRPQYRPMVMHALDHSLAGRTDTFHLEFEIRAAGQPDWRWLQLAGNASQRSADGKAVRLIGTGCDVTDRKKLHAGVEQQSRELEKAAREKAEFLATISHCIRTPLDAVIGATSVLATDDLGGEVREMVETIQRSGQLLQSVLNDALDLRCSNQALVQLEVAPFNVAELLRHCCQLVEPMARRKQLELRIFVSREVCPNLSGDAVRLQQVLINLLSNAVKFTGRGSVQLSASVESWSDPATQTITFAVRDTGAGIEEHAQRSLFERFEQLHPQTLAGPSGTGLGLAISQQLVGAMGGVIVCQSKVDSGSTFSFTLQFPVLPAEQASAGGSAAAASPAAAAVERLPARVLIAEDNPVNQRVLAAMLRRLNCHVQVALNGAEAVEACRRGSFDVIFMDCDMPVLNGLDATRRIRQLPNGSAVPIIASTAHALPANLLACRQAGMSDTLTKPLTLARLTAVLEQWARPAPSPVEGIQACK